MIITGTNCIKVLITGQLYLILNSCFGIYDERCVLNNTTLYCGIHIYIYILWCVHIYIYCVNICNGFS